MAKEVILKDEDGNQMLPKTKAEFVVTSDGGTVEARMTLADNSYQKVDGVEINSEGFKTDQSELTDSRLTVDGGINIFKTSVEFAPETEGNEIKIYNDGDELHLKAKNGIYLHSENGEIECIDGDVNVNENLYVYGTLKDGGNNEYAKKKDVYSVVDGIGVGSSGVTLSRGKSIKLGSDGEITAAGTSGHEYIYIHSDSGVNINSPSISLTASSIFDFIGNMFVDGDMGVNGTLVNGDDEEYALKKDVVEKEDGRGLIDTNIAQLVVYDEESDLISVDSIGLVCSDEDGKGHNIGNELCELKKNDSIYISTWADDVQPTVGAYMYKPTEKKLWLGYMDGAEIKKKEVTMKRNVVYIYNNSVYVYNGTELVSTIQDNKPVRIVAWEDTIVPVDGVYVYNPTTKTLYVCHVPDEGEAYRTPVQMKDSVVYVYNHQVYVYNGTELV